MEPRLAIYDSIVTGRLEQVVWDCPQIMDFVGKFAAHCSLAPVKIVDPTVTFLTPDIATLVCHADETVSCNGKLMGGGNTNITSVWVLTPADATHPARWQMHLHTEFADVK